MTTNPADRFDDVDDSLPLPGALGTPEPEDVSDLERSARRTLQELDRLGLLRDHHAIDRQLLLDLCRGYSSSLRASRGKITVAASHVAGQIMDLLTSLPRPDVTIEDPEDEFAAIAKELREAHVVALAEVDKARQAAHSSTAATA